MHKSFNENHSFLTDLKNKFGVIFPNVVIIRFPSHTWPPKGFNSKGRKYIVLIPYQVFEELWQVNILFSIVSQFWKVSD